MNGSANLLNHVGGPNNKAATTHQAQSATEGQPSGGLTTAFLVRDSKPRGSAVQIRPQNLGMYQTVPQIELSGLNY